MMTADQADAALLGLANHKGKFGIQGRITDAAIQDAFERGIDNEWFRFVDMSPVAAVPHQYVRVFRLTEAGKARLAEAAKAIGGQH